MPPDSILCLRWVSSPQSPPRHCRSARQRPRRRDVAIRNRRHSPVVFVWVMHEQEIIDSVLGRLDLWLCSDVVCVTLTADEKTLRERLEKDIAAGLRDSSVIERSLDRARAAASLGTAKVDTSGLTPGEAADRVIALAGHIA